MKKQILAVLVLVCTLLTMLPAGAAAAESLIPEHVPQTYSFKWSDFQAGCQQMFLFKGDTLIYEPEPYDAAAYAALEKGQWLTMNKGFYLAKGNADATAQIATINEVSTYSGEATVYTSITITSDKPVHLSGSVSHFPISSVWNDADWKGLAYRGMCIEFSVYDAAYPISYNITANSTYPEAQLYGNEADPTKYAWSYEEYDLAIDGKPVVPGLHFNGWNTGFGQDGYFFTPLGEGGSQFKVNSPVLWTELLSGWQDGVIFHADYRNDADCGTVTLDANGGSIDGKGYKYYEVDLSWTGESGYLDGRITDGFDLRAHIPVREDTVFGGWYQDAEFTNPVNAASEIVYYGYPTSRNDRSVTLYAAWTPVLYAITTETVGNGTLTVSAQSAAAGSEITLTVTPAAGYQLKSLTVLDESGKALQNGPVISGNRFVMPKMNLKLLAVFERTVSMDAFADVNPDSWYYNAVEYVVRYDLFKGTAENTFEPNTPMNRAMLVTVLWRADGMPAPVGDASFADVQSGKWYTGAVLWAVENQIVNGIGGGKFDPTGAVTREQMAAILYRYCDKKGLDTTKRANLSAFPDAAKVSNFAEEALQWAVAEKLIGGTIVGNSSYLDPQGSATRAQVATILMRFLERTA